MKKSSVSLCLCVCKMVPLRFINDNHLHFMPIFHGFRGKPKFFQQFTKKTKKKGAAASSATALPPKKSKKLLSHLKSLALHPTKIFSPAYLKAAQSGHGWKHPGRSWW